jgi:hypothetical protein
MTTPSSLARMQSSFVTSDGNKNTGGSLFRVSDVDSDVLAHQILETLEDVPRVACVSIYC